MVVTDFNYEPRDHIWAIVNHCHENGGVGQQQALVLIQEYIYCMEGVVYSIQQPKNESEHKLMGYAFSVAYNKFLAHVR